MKLSNVEDRPAYQTRLPSKEKRSSLQIGDRAMVLAIRQNEQEWPGMNESGMVWLEVVEKVSSGYVGKILALPSYIKSAEETMKFLPENILKIVPAS